MRPNLYGNKLSLIFFLTVPLVRYLINKKNYQVVYISLRNMKKVPCDVFSIQYKFSIYLAVFVHVACRVLVYSMHEL